MRANKTLCNNVDRELPITALNCFLIRCLWREVADFMRLLFQPSQWFGISFSLIYLDNQALMRAEKKIGHKVGIIRKKMLSANAANVGLCVLLPFNNGKSFQPTVPFLFPAWALTAMCITPHYLSQYCFKLVHWKYTEMWSQTSHSVCERAHHFINLCKGLCLLDWSYLTNKIRRDSGSNPDATAFGNLVKA